MAGRRQFLQVLGHGVLAAGLTALTARLLMRRGGSPGLERSRHSCSNHWICSDCSRLADCPLPQALSARDHGLKPGSRPEPGPAKRRSRGSGSHGG